MAVDISDALLDKARSRGLAAPQVVLHHLDVADALRAIRRLLKPGSTLCFAEPNMLNPQVFLERHPPGVLRRYFAYVSPDETASFRGALRRLLEESGFVDVWITPFDWLHPATPPWLIGQVSGVGRAVESVPGVREFAGSLYICARVPAIGRL